MRMGQQLVITNKLLIIISLYDKFLKINQFNLIRYYDNEIIFAFIFVLEDTTIEGYHIPKRSVLVYNIGSIHFDPDIYPDPQKFDPERFLDADGKKLKREGPYPYGLGKHLLLLTDYLRVLNLKRNKKLNLYDSLTTADWSEK